MHLHKRLYIKKKCIFGEKAPTYCILQQNKAESKRFGWQVSLLHYHLRCSPTSPAPVQSRRQKTQQMSWAWCLVKVRTQQAPRLHQGHRRQTVATWVTHPATFLQKLKPSRGCPACSLLETPKNPFQTITLNPSKRVTFWKASTCCGGSATGGHSWPRQGRTLLVSWGKDPPVTALGLSQEAN